jgi:dTDP-4-amino-4,6-dideoxygalactose transaminase
MGKGVDKQSWKVPFLDLSVSDDKMKEKLLNAVERVLSHGRIVMGPEVSALEERVALRIKRKYAVGVNSGTDALFLGLKALGIGHGDEVITTSLSWIATANAIALTGATPVFADIGDDLNIDPNSVRELVTPQTKAIMPVHYTGKVCRMSELAKIAYDHSLSIIEDASQAFDAEYENRKAGSFGTIACFSMNPMKIFAAFGEAGMVLTDREDICERLVALRYNGTIDREVCIEPSLNGRLDTLQAAILLERLGGVENIINKRRQIAAWYHDRLRGVVDIPEERSEERDVYYTYTIRADRRDELKAFLEDNGIETKVQHPYLMPEQPAYKENVRGVFINAQRLVKRILCIPVNETIAEADVDYISSRIREFYGAK